MCDGVHCTSAIITTAAAAAAATAAAAAAVNDDGDAGVDVRHHLLLKWAWITSSSRVRQNFVGAALQN